MLMRNVCIIDEDLLLNARQKKMFGVQYLRKMSTTLAPTMLPMQDIVGFSEDGDQADYAAAFGTPSPIFLTLAPSSKKKSMSSLEIMLVAFAVAVGVVTLCLLISGSKKR